MTAKGQHCNCRFADQQVEQFQVDGPLRSITRTNYTRSMLANALLSWYAQGIAEGRSPEWRGILDKLRDYVRIPLDDKNSTDKKLARDVLRSLQSKNAETREAAMLQIQGFSSLLIKDGHAVLLLVADGGQESLEIHRSLCHIGIHCSICHFGIHCSICPFGIHCSICPFGTHCSICP